MHSPREHKKTSSGMQPGSAEEHNGSGEILYFMLVLPSSTLGAL